MLKILKCKFLHIKMFLKLRTVVIKSLMRIIEHVRFLKRFNILDLFYTQCVRACPTDGLI